MSTALHVQLLGEFRLAYGDTLLTTVSTARLKSLLVYLLLHREAPQSRQYLAFLFWPDTHEAQARANLRNLIHHLRRALPNSKDYLLVETQTIQWNPQAAYTLDVEVFTRLASRAAIRSELQQAIDHYRGDLLPDCYEDWIQAERERLREIYITTLECVIRQLEAERDYTGAISYAQRLLRSNPLQEETYRQLMQLHAANRDRAKALHIYHSCADVLKRELGVEPGPAVQEVYLRLLNISESPALQERRNNVPLIGRHGECKVIQSAWRATLRGQGRCVLVRGEAGIGKTRLVEEMIDWAERQGIAVSRAYCYASEGSLSYAPVAAWLRARPLPKLNEVWIVEAVRLLPEILVEHPDLPRPEPVTESWQRLRLLKGLVHALLQDRSALILVIEDLQWCDRETLEWMYYLLQYQREAYPRLRLLIISTLRTGEIASYHPLENLLADLRRSDLLTEIELGPLDESETSELVRQAVGGEVEPAWEVKLFQEAEGNPLFVVEMARLIQERGLDDCEFSPLLPPKVQEVIQARLGQITPTGRELAEAAAVIGRQFTFSVLKQAAGGEEEKVVRGLDELWRRRIIRERGTDTYDFSHDKIRQVAYEQMGAIRQRYCHRKVAEALEMLPPNDLDAMSGQIAAHYEQAGSIQKAIIYYYLAAKAAQRLFANQQAIQLLGRGLQLFESERSHELPAIWAKETQGQLFELQGDTLTRIGNYGDACLVHYRALMMASELDHFWQARLHRKIGNNLREQFNYEQAVAAYQMAQASIGEPPQENAKAWWWEWIELQLDHSLVYFYLSKQDDVIHIVERLTQVIEQFGTVPQRGRYYRRLVTIKFRQTQFTADEETVSLSRKALATIRESDDVVEIASAHFGLGLALICSGDLSEAKDQIQLAIKLTEQTGQALLPVCYAYLSVIYRKRNDVETAVENARRVIEITTLQKDPIYIAMAKSTFAWAAWRWNQLLEAEQQARQALEIWESLPDAFPFRWLALWPLVGSALAKNHISDAIGAAQALFGAYQQPPPAALAAILSAAIKTWDNDQPADACALLDQAAKLAMNYGYL